MSYKLEYPYTNMERADFIIRYNNKGFRIEEDINGIYALQPNEKLLNGEVVDNTEELNSEFLENAKNKKLEENEKIRDEFLNAPVEYKDILWDADLDQKINLAYSIENLQDGESTNWVGADGISILNATKEDLKNILALIVAKTTFVWQLKNPQIKTAINHATTIEEVENIEINYTYSEEYNDIIN